MRPIFKSLLAELSPNWLRARSLRGKERVFQPEFPAHSAGAEDRYRERPRRAQTPCYVPPKRNGDDIASNM